MRVPLTFLPHGITVEVEQGVTVTEAARAAGIALSSPCGGRGVCGACAIRVVEGDLAPADVTESAGLLRSASGVRLACRARVVGSATIGIIGEHVAPQGALTPPVARDPLVAAVDLGTTTVTASVMDAVTGEVRGTATVENLQRSWGADVLSRLAAACAGEAGALRVAAEQSVVLALSDATGGAPVHVRRVVIAANTAMMTLLTGADPSSLSTAPFHVSDAATRVSADSTIRDSIASGASVDLVPPLGAFVGGDALAAALAVGMLAEGDRSLLIDVGTNAEIVLSGPDGLVAASTAAGPAFEAVGLSCGGPAIVGAVSHVTIGEDGVVGLEVIGGETPRWLSGSGLISALAEMRRRGIVSADGLLSHADTILLTSAVGENGVRSVILGDGISISQLDIRAVQLAKAAVRAGIVSLLSADNAVGGFPDRIVVTGAFGAAISSQDLVDIGVVPANARNRTEVVSAAALVGAAMCARDEALFEGLVRVARRATVVDLPGVEGFAGSLMDGLDLSEFWL